MKKLVTMVLSPSFEEDKTICEPQTKNEQLLLFPVEVVRFFIIKNLKAD